MVRALRALADDLATIRRSPDDEIALRTVKTLHAFILASTDNEWASTLHELRRLVSEAGFTEELARLAPVSLLPVERRPSRPPPAEDTHRAIVEARLPDGRVTFVFVELGDVVRHRSERGALDDLWPQEARIERIEGAHLRVELLGRHRQSLRLNDTWRVDDVVLPSSEDLSCFERAAPSDLGAFGLDLAQDQACSSVSAVAQEAAKIL